MKPTSTAETNKITRGENTRHLSFTDRAMQRSSRAPTQAGGASHSGGFRTGEAKITHVDSPEARQNGREQKKDQIPECHDRVPAGTTRRRRICEKHASQTVRLTSPKAMPKAGCLSTPNGMLR